MLKKTELTIVAILILALAVMIIQERIWPPKEALASSSTVTPLSGEEVFQNNEQVKDTAVIEEGDSIKTGEDSRALVTFADGSTIELEPGTVITIDMLTDTGISVGQQIGRTWSAVKKLAGGPVNDFKINTPSARVVVWGTLIDTLVEENGDSLIGAFKGTVEVTAGGITRLVEAGMQSLIKSGEAPQLPQSIPLAQNRLEFTIDGGAWALVVDSPQERSIGVVSPGIVVNQIPRSTTTGAQAEPQFIVVPAAENNSDSKYYVALYGREGAQDVDVMVTGYSGGEEVFTVAKENIIVPSCIENNDQQNKYVASFIVTIDDSGMVTGGAFDGDFVPAPDHTDYNSKQKNWPGHLEIKDWATVRADEAITPQANFSAGMKDGKIDFSNFSTGDIISYSWDFGDGNTSDEINPSHEYGQGEYMVSLTVEGPAGEDTSRITIYIFNVPGD